MIMSKFLHDYVKVSSWMICIYMYYGFFMRHIGYLLHDYETAWSILMSRLVGKPTMWFPNRSDTNRPGQS